MKLFDLHKKKGKKRAKFEILCNSSDLKIEKMNPGEYIFKNGDELNRVYYVMDGEVEGYGKLGVFFNRFIPGKKKNMYLERGEIQKGAQGTRSF